LVHGNHMSTITILFPGVGGEPTIAATKTLRQTWPGPEKLRMIGCDCDQNKRAILDLDHFFSAPRRDDPQYVDILVSHCEQYDVDVVWPNPPEEQVVIHQRRAEFEKRGIRLVLGSLEGLSVFSDKQKTYEAAGKLGIAVPRWRATNNWLQLCEAARKLGYPDRPVVFRRVSGKGAIGLVIVSADRSKAAELLFNKQTTLHTLPLESLQPIIEDYPRWPRAIATEFLPGKEFEVDCFCSDEGLRYAVVRQHLAMWGGTASIADTVDRADLVDLSRRLLEAVHWRNLCSVQFMEDEQGTPVLLEVNPRMASNVALPVRAGVDLPLAALLMCLGRPIPDFPKPQFGVRSVRYLGQGFIS